MAAKKIVMLASKETMEAVERADSAPSTKPDNEAEVREVAMDVVEDR